MGIIAANVLQLNADFVLHKICDLGAVSKVCWLVRRLVPKPFIFFFLRGIENFFTKILAN